MSFSSALVLSFIPCHFLTKKTKQKTLSYKTTEKRLWLTNTKMYFNSNQLPAECIKSYQELFIIQTIKRNDSLKTTQTCFWTTALHCSFVPFSVVVWKLLLLADFLSQAPLSWNMLMWVSHKNNIRKRQIEISRQSSPKHCNGILFSHYCFYLNTSGETVPIKKKRNTKTNHRVCRPRVGTFLPRFI